MSPGFALSMGQEKRKHLREAAVRPSVLHAASALLRHRAVPGSCLLAYSLPGQYSSGRMSITFDIPADVQASVASIPDLDLRVALYLRHEGQMEEIRLRRHSPPARQIVAEAVRQAERDKAGPFDRDASFAQLRSAHQKITARL